MRRQMNPSASQTDVERLVNEPYSFEVERRNGIASTSGKLSEPLLSSRVAVCLTLALSVLLQTLVVY
jgi:hypothetical protein